MKRSSHSKTQSVSSLSSDEEMAVARLNDTYDLIKIIGRGSTCKVWLARHVDQKNELLCMWVAIGGSNTPGSNRAGIALVEANWNAPS